MGTGANQSIGAPKQGISVMKQTQWLAAATFLLACAAAALPAAAQTAIKIGWANSFSPPGNVIGGREAKVGGEIALDLFKETSPKVDGRDVEIIYEDTR